MKRLLTLSLVAFTFVAGQAVAAPINSPAEPTTAMDEQMKGTKDTADADKAEAKTAKKGGHHKKHAGHKKHGKKAADAAAK